MDNWIIVIGYIAQLLFSARLLVQWILSEKAGKTLSPTIFWQLSIIASYLLVVYGALRNDFTIILGQVISYFIYIRNLQLKGNWQQLHIIFRMVCIVTPIVTLGYVLSNWEHEYDLFFRDNDIPQRLMVWGSAGQIIFTLRFVYQWIVSNKVGRSILPLGFWIISIIGSIMIVSYGIYRKDQVLIIGQGFGLIIYIRNTWIIIKNKLHNQNG